MKNTDVDDIKFVINFDYPNCSEDYVHRIGRTARSNKSGTAYTFFTTSNGKQANDLISVLKEANQRIHPTLYEIADNGRGGSGRMRNRGRPGFQGRNDHGGRRDDPRGGRNQGRDGFAGRNDRMRDEDRVRPNSRPERGGPTERGGYGREGQGPAFGREAQNASYNRNGQSAGYTRENSGSAYNREGMNAGYNREGASAAYNRDSHSAGYREGQAANKSGLLNTPQAGSMYQRDARGPPPDNRYASRPQSAISAPRPPPRPEGNPPPQAAHGSSMNGQYANGQSRGGHTSQMNSHSNPGNAHMNSTHNRAPPQHYPNMQMNGPPPTHRTGQQTMNGSARPTQAMTNAQTIQSLFQPPPPPPPIPSGSAGKGSLMGPPPAMNNYY